MRWRQPDRGMMWQAENPELAREFPAGTASKARQSRLHQAQGVFPVFVFHSFVQFLNINVPKIVQFERFVFQNSTLRNTASWEVGKGERRRQSESWWQRKVGGKCFWVGIYLLLFIFHVRVRISLYSNGWTIECRRVSLSTIIASARVTDCSFAQSLQQSLAQSLQHLARSHFTSTLRAVPSE